MRTAAGIKIFVNDQLCEAAREVLRDFEVLERKEDDESLSQCTAALLCPSASFPQRTRKMRNLKVIQLMTAGVDTLDFKAIPRGVAVFSNAGAYTKPVAEHAWGLVMAAAKGASSRKAKVTPRLLSGRTLLVLGCGAIGCELARMARAALSMRTLGVSRSFRSKEMFDEKYGLADLQHIIGRADVVVNALPLTLQTRAVLDYETLRRAKATAVIVNVGRGETVDERAILRLLRERPETRYATDVFWERDGREVFDTQLWELPNFSGTLHTAGGGNRNAMEKAQAMAAENLIRFMTTGNASNSVNLADYVART